MKKLLLLLSVICAGATSLYAAPGDTTWITVYENRKIDHYGDFDTTAYLPPAGNRYRKIRMHYILGRYNCAPGSQYCGSWDYTTLVYAKPQNADTVELARIITPYATDWPITRQHDYIVDVTDYASILHGNLDMQYQYEGYSWGFTLTLKIEFIEGIPPMDAVSARNIYDGYFAYGKVSDPIENHLVPKNFQYAAPASNAYIKNIISGHGSDNTGCGEFCSKYYQQKINGTLLSQKQLWKNDCGYNNVYPQTGTWIFDRANWCPGEAVYPIYHDLNSVTNPGTPFEVNMDFQPYTSPNQSNVGGYNVVSQLISYKAPNHTLDASIEDIIAPTNDPNYFRSNGICANPKIKIKNTGTTALTALTITYRLQGGQAATYNWTGNLAFLEEEIVDLGTSASVFAGNESDQFLVSLTSINGQGTDENVFNNTYRATFKAVNSYPNKFRVYFKTNNAPAASNSAVNETSWKILDAAGTVVASRENNAFNTVYIDTLDLPAGCYTFVMDDEKCDGISWWYYPNYPVNPGSGQVRFIRESSQSILKNFSGDFGCQLKENFTVGYTLDVPELDKTQNGFQLYPNPASSSIQLIFDQQTQQDVTCQIMDLSGKVVKSCNFKPDSSSIYTVETNEFHDGIYLIHCGFNDGTITSKKFVINH